MADLERNKARKLTGLLLNAQVFTPNDTASSFNEVDVFHIATAGDVVATIWPEDPQVGGIGGAETMSLTAGYHPIPVTKIWATGTTATGFTGFEQSD